MRKDLLAWQWSHYAAGHTTRTALVVHLLTVPLFQLGSLSVLASPFTGGWPALASFSVGGLLAMIVALAALVPAGHKAFVHVTITDDFPLAQAFVIIEALPET